MFYDTPEGQKYVGVALAAQRVQSTMRRAGQSRSDVVNAVIASEMFWNNDKETPVRDVIDYCMSITTMEDADFHDMMDILKNGDVDQKTSNE